MKREEFFEALSDIDENMVACAKSEEEAVVPVMVTPKKSLVKPICAGAACAVLTAGLITAVVINANRQPDSILNPNVTLGGDREPDYKTSITVLNKSRYPADMIYPYTGDYSNLEIKYLCDEYPYACNGSNYKSYDELAADSSLIVVGTFIDDTSQVTDDHDAPDFVKVMAASSYNKYVSFNTLKVEKVLKSDGQAWEGDEIVIAQPFVNADGGMYSLSQLTPMIKGDKWVYFLNQYSDSYPEETYGKGAYYSVNDYEGRYPVPGSENSPFKYRENTNGVVAPAVFNESVYSELEEKIANAKSEKRPPYEVESKKVTSFAEELDLERWPVGITVEFEMGEFADEVFGIADGGLYVRKSGDEGKTDIFGGPGCYVNLGSTYLCDLNGDGKREICTEISFGSGIVNNFIWALDYADDKPYALNARGEWDYFLRKKDGELEYLSSPFDMSITMYPDENASGAPLTLDVMKEFKPYADSGETVTTHENEAVIQIMDFAYASSYELYDIPVEFDMEEFPGVLFRRGFNGAGGETLYAIEDDGENTVPIFSCERITSIYLCDLNNDGKRDIVTGICINNGDGSDKMLGKSVAFIDYENRNACLASDEDNFTYLLGEMDDKLYLSKFDAETGEELSFEPLSLVNMMTDPVWIGNNTMFLFKLPEIEIPVETDAPSTDAEDAEIELNVHNSPQLIGAEKGGLPTLDYNGIEYCFPLFDSRGIYIIDKDNDIFAPINEAMEFNPESRIDAAMMDIAGYYENFEYVGKIRDTYLGGLTIDEGYVYRHGDDLILIYNCDNAVRYNLDTCERLFNIKFTEEERHDLLARKIDFEETLLKYGVEYDPSIYYAALLYEPCEEASDTQKITYNKNMGDYSICVNIEAEECRHGRRCYDLHQNENNICIRDGSGNVVCSRAFPWEMNVIPEADSTDLTFEVLEFDGGNMLAMGFPVNVNGVQCRRMSFFCFDKSSIDFAGIGDNYNFDETNPVIRGDLRCEDNCICFSALGSDGSFGDCHYLTDFSHRCFTHCEGSNCANHNHNYNHNYGNGNGYGYGYGANGNNSANTNSTTNSTHHSDSHHSNHH